MLKFLQIFLRLHFDLSFADALLHIPKFTSMFKSILSNKEKLFELVNTPLNENCSAVLFKKLPKKLGDPGKFLIHCNFPELDECLALDDLGASINLMPLSVWKKLSLLELTPTRMTLELSLINVDPRIPLILGWPFLRTAQALIDVHGEELILRDGDANLIFHVDNTLKHPHKHGNESINMINFIDITCEDRFSEVLKFKKSNHPSSGNPTPSSGSVIESLSPLPIPYEDSDSLVEEIDILLSYFNDSSPDYETFCFDIEEKSSGSPTSHSDHSLLDYEAFYFNDDHIEEKSGGSTTTHSYFSLHEYDLFIFDLSIDPFPPADRSVSHHEEFADELDHIISSPEYDCFYFDIKPDPRELIILFEENISKDLTKEFRSPKLNDFPLFLSDCDSTFSEEFFEIDRLVLFPSENKDKVFNPGIFIIKRVQSKC
ncbi:hypothetical protein Tco_0289707 [Tanacetum coccineum]